MSFDAARAYDAAFAGRITHWVDHVGRAQPFDVGQWSASADDADHALFVSPCDGPTIDVGCGPGRLVAAIAERRIPAMGIDVSSEAVRQTRSRGAVAVRRDLFDELPCEGEWDFALLADGNVGIGGDPVRLLRRLRDIVAPTGTAIVEVARRGTGVAVERRRLRVDGRLSEPFAWAVVGLDAIEDMAQEAGWRVATTTSIGVRHAVTLQRDTP
jgi:SAM-dependent methyltransferase